MTTTLFDGHQKHAYFLLSAAGAAIALAINQTQNTEIEWASIPLAIGIGCWGVSFYNGCRLRDSALDFISSRIDYILYETGQHHDAGNDTQKIIEGSETSLAEVKRLSDVVENYWVRQFRYLIAGGVFYMAWHIRSNDPENMAVAVAVMEPRPQTRNLTARAARPHRATRSIGLIRPAP